MKRIPPNAFRIRSGPMGSGDHIGMNGAFLIPSCVDGKPLRVISSDQKGWEHVSVSRLDRCPTWEEMCQIKNEFWQDFESCFELHPAAADYVNCHPYCLHMWRPVGGIPQYMLPPAWMVGPK